MKKKLLDLQLSQAEKAVALGYFGKTEQTELQAIHHLVRGAFGASGLLETGPDEPGVIYGGYYLDPATVPSHRRRRQLVFRGYTAADFTAQIALWRQLGRPS